MNNIFLGAFLLTFWAACQTPAAKQENTTAASVTTDALALPFQASYSTQWTQDVSDQDLQVEIGRAHV